MKPIIENPEMLSHTNRCIVIACYPDKTIYAAAEPRQIHGDIASEIQARHGDLNADSFFKAHSKPSGESHYVTMQYNNQTQKQWEQAILALIEAGHGNAELYIAHEKRPNKTASVGTPNELLKDNAQKTIENAIETIKRREKT